MNDAPRMGIVEERDGAVLTLTMDYPARRNALSLPLREQLATILDRVEGDPGVRAIVLTGSEGVFSAGGDISSMNVAGLAAGRDRLRRVHRVIRMMVAGKTPVVAAVEGWCVGAGLSMACACDTIIAAEDAKFAAGFGRIGLIGDLGLPFTLPGRVGLARAKQILFYGHQLAAVEAERIGLVDQLVPPGEALAAAMVKARFLAEQAPLPIALTKAILAEGLDEALETERHYQSTLFLTADHAEGREAFLAKRPPQFTGG